MIYVMIATSQTYPGAVERVVFSFPGDKSQAINYARAENIASKGVRYKIEGPLPENLPALVLAMQHDMRFDIVNNQAAQAGQVNAHNTGNNRPAGQLNSAGFQELADQDLPIEDAIYGDAIPNNFGDIINVGGRSHER